MTKRTEGFKDISTYACFFAFSLLFLPFLSFAVLVELYLIASLASVTLQAFAVLLLLDFDPLEKDHLVLQVRPEMMRLH
jgi:hypothetical protein